MKFVSVSDFLSQIKLKKDAIPAKAKLNERLRFLEDTHNIDPEGYRVSLWYMLIKIEFCLLLWAKLTTYINRVIKYYWLSW